MHKFYFKYFHYKSFQYYVITSNKQYNITLCFCKVLKRITNTSSIPVSTSESLLESERPHQHPRVRSSPTSTSKRVQNMKSHLNYSPMKYRGHSDYSNGSSF